MDFDRYYPPPVREKERRLMMACAVASDLCCIGVELFSLIEIVQGKRPVLA